MPSIFISLAIIIPTISFISSRSLFHRGILTYGLRELRLRLEGGTLRVEGEDLALEEMDAEDLRVTGRIRCVRLEE